uniref:Ribosomal protein S6 kinase-like 1 n=1 Tax=Sinocyclocheilus rhinocerous TaxID=307959 RepID=A0A673K8E8_9TELE
ATSVFTTTDPTPGSGSYYLLDAAQQIRMALDREVKEDYDAAFSYYKNGVDFLCLTVDPNTERREAVKRKTTQYLKRAEEIFISYLQDNISKGSSHLGGYSSLHFRSIRPLSSPVENLAMCKVVGIIDKVCVKYLLLSGSFLPKSSWKSRERSTIIPQGVPFMVKLLKYYVSEDTVFLHLEHVQVPNTSRLPPRNQAHDGFPHEQGVPNCKPSGNGQISQFVAELSKVSSHRNPFECTPQKQESISLDFSSRVNTGDMVREVGKEDTENWQFFNSSFKQPQVGMISCLSAPTTNSSCWSETELEQQVKVDGATGGAQILLALESLHEQGIVCQDLNPRNILLRDACLTYFGQWTEVQPEINPKAMEEMYCAPEIGGVSKITEACDWWSLGALLYELLTGTPLWQCHPTGVHPHTPLHIPEFLSAAAASLLTELLQFDARYRLGSGGGGVSDIKSHPFFNSVPWLTLSSSVQTP